AHLLPGLGTGPGGGDPARDQLSTRLGSLELPACRAGPAPADWGPWTSGPLPVSADAEAGHSLTSVEVLPGDGGWQISLAEAGNALTVPVGSGAWAVSENAGRHGAVIPVAASGGWLRDGTLRAEIIFLETPHRMDITCSPGSGTA